MKRLAPLVSCGLLLGAGMGGFLDGIVLHQLLQWHNMLSSVVPPTDLVTMKLNMLWDGVFHVLTWLTTAVGLWRLWLTVQRQDVLLSSPALIAALLLGWGMFNALEGTLNHQILGLHHVHPGSAQLAWDLGFIASGLGLCCAGWLILRSVARS
jgi:uncharacterized membrane protein